MYRSSVVLVLVVVSSILTTPVSAEEQIAITGSWKPPIVPIQVSYDSVSGFDLQFTGEVVTPFGPFSFSVRQPDKIDPHSTYFVFNSGSEEQWFRIAKRGSIEISAEGKHNLDSAQR